MAKALALRKTLGTLLSYISDAQDNPETANLNDLQKAQDEANKIRTQLKDVEANIAEMKTAQQK